MSLIKNKIAPLLLVASFITLKEISSFEINTVILTLMSIFFIVLNKGRVFKIDFELLTVLILIIIIGVLSSIFNKPTIYNFIKDLLYFSKPLILILLGYFATRWINNWVIIFKTLIYLGVGYASYHIIHTIAFTDFHNATVSEIRGINGLSNIIEIFAIALIVLGYKYPSHNVITNKITRNIFLSLLLVSFVFYFSRTMLVGLLFLILGVLNYLKLNRKGLKYGLIILLMFGGFYTYVYSVKIDRQGNELESFLYKLKIAPAEIFSPKLDLNNKAALWDHWRAYEAYCAFEDLNKKPFNYLFGRGFGALVDLKFVAPLSKKGMRYIPILHNGYIFILYKTGVLGLILYLIFLFYLYLQSYANTESLDNRVFRNILSATAIYIIFSSLIITGLYNLEEITPIVLGIFLYLKTNSKLTDKIIDENRNNRN